MPYALRGSTVVNRATGAPVPGGKHPNRRRALAHLRALMANVPEAKDYSAHVGQVIAGRLIRGAGGKFSASGAAAPASERVPYKKLPSAPKPKKAAKPKKGKRAAKPKAPKKTPEQRAAEHAAQQAANRSKVLAGLGIDASAQAALDALRAGKQPDAEAVAKAGLEAAGLVERAADGSYRMTSSGRSAIEAAGQGDAGRAGDIISAARDRLSARQGRQATAADRRRAAAARHAAAGKRGSAGPRKALAPRAPAARSSTPVKLTGGGGGAAAPKPAKQAQPTAQVSQQLQDAAQALSDGNDVSQADADALVRNGLARRHADGTLILTGAGRKVITTKEGRDISRPYPIAVFKDAAGQWRWIARTTTAFEDRDNEVISTKALDEDVTRADGDGKYGPLRWWHMGTPNPLDEAAPWGPGVDLGWCDFNAMSGKTLIESGTFKSEAIARAVEARADDLELSPGFFHAANEPDQTGVFTHIRRFERSLVPKWAGRASNPYTGLIVQGKEAMDEKKIQALKDLGIPEATITALVADVQQTEKAAEADNVRYKEVHPAVEFFRSFFSDVKTTTKEDEPPAAAEAEAAPAAPAEADAAPDPLAALKAEVEALTAEVATLKAFGKTDEPAKADEVVVEENAAGDMPPDEPPIDDGSGDAGGLTLSTEDLGAIGQLLSGLLEPLIGAMGITQKLEGHLGELKTMMGGYVKQKDDSEAQRTEQIAALKAEIDQQQAKLAELIGDEPRAGYRASAASDNVLSPQVQAAIKDNNGNGGVDFSDLTAQLFPDMTRR